MICQLSAKRQIYIYLQLILYCMFKQQQKPVAVFSDAMIPISHWLYDSCLHLKTFYMFFSRLPANSEQPCMFINGETLYAAEQFKYLGVVFDFYLNFKQQ